MTKCLALFSFLLDMRFAQTVLEHRKGLVETALSYYEFTYVRGFLQLFYAFYNVNYTK